MRRGVRGAIGVTGLTVATSLLLAFAGNPFSGPFGGPTAPPADSASTTEPTFTSTQTDGGAAFVVPTGADVCLNGAACTVRISYDGGSVGVVGAELDVPIGFTDSQKVNPSTSITPGSVIAQAASGQRAFGVAVDGARFYIGAAGNLYCYSDGTVVQCASPWSIPSLETNTIGSFTPGRVVDVFNPHIYPTSTLGTCNGSSDPGSVPEGTVKVQSGASLSAQSRVCACVSDGAGPPAFTWINTGCPNTAGTSTTCPACP